MLNRLKLTNFRKHRDTDLTLQTGLMVLRGNNEAGKSTLIEGVCYVLFGVAALRSPLEDAVTHGEAVNTLKAELWITIDGVEYHIRRSKAGAEVNYADGKVTGQKEVTNFLCGRMGVDPSAAARLMLANQNEIRGALESGPKATTELIERLAEFDQLDLLIERMQEHLTLGSTSALQARLEDAEKQLADLGEPTVPDYAGMEANIQALAAAQRASQEAVNALEQEVQKAQGQVDLARSAQAKYEQAVESASRAGRRFQKACTDLEEALAEANKDLVWPSTEEAVRTRISELEQAQRIVASHKAVEACFTPEAARFNGTRDTLAERIREASDGQVEVAQRVSAAKVRIADARARISTGTCGFCDQDFSHLPQVAEKNAKLQEVIDAGEAQIKSDSELLAGLKASETNLRAILRVSDHRMTLFSSYQDLVKLADASLPSTFIWTGPDIDALKGADEELVKLRRELKERQAAETALAQAKARVETLTQARVSAELELGQARLAEEVAELRPSLADAEAAREGVLARRRPLTVAASEAQTAHVDAQYALKDAQRAHAAAIQKREHLEDGVVSLKDQIRIADFNNTLLKRVRQCRPMIADKLWGIVLSAVSSYFSEMRGVKSKVTKDIDGFKVDGHGVASLSGSTLDILGLAIRVALVRTFLPGAPFMVLDEPCAAMDATRTEATLGFVVACGFSQVLLVTHEDTSETVADHMIQL